MARIALEALTPGLKLSKPVFNLNGVLLLRAGEVLSAKHLEIFKTWGVREAEVVREDGTEPDAAPEVAAPPEVLAAAEQEVSRRFRRAGVSKDPTMGDIKRLATRRAVLKLMVQAAPAGDGPTDRRG